MRPDIKQHFSRFLSASPGRLHFAAHSHHFWPDVTLKAQEQCWLDAARHADDKWDGIFGDLMPAVRTGIARTLNLPDARTIAFAPNTHELVLRLLSCFPANRPVRILTTDSEFYSFRRQTQRLAEDGAVEITRIPTQPFDTFAQRFADAASGNFDMVFFSHVFFDSGYAVPTLEKIVSAVKSRDTFIVIDGYHGFMAMPTDLSNIADRAFYVAGGYKYAMAGEGACFMHCPPGYGARPRDTGWFAEMDSLAAEKSGKVDYAAGGERFSGATIDPSGLYRFRAVLDWLKSLNIGVSDIHAHVHELQKFFVDNLKSNIIKEDSLLVGTDNPDRGHFLTFRTPDAEKIKKNLNEQNVITDNRGDRLRFGFGIYHDRQDVERLLGILGE